MKHAARNTDRTQVSLNDFEEQIEHSSLSQMRRNYVPLDDEGSTRQGSSHLGSHNASSRASSAGGFRGAAHSANPDAGSCNSTQRTSPYLSLSAHDFPQTGTSFFGSVKNQAQDVLSALSLNPAITWVILIALVLCCLGIGLGIGSCIHRGLGGGSAYESQSFDAVDDAAADNASSVASSSALSQVDYALNPSDFSQLSSDASSVYGFSLSGGESTPSLSDEQSSAITQAVSAINAKQAEVGFVLVDVESGCGFSYNVDDKVYGASSFKGPFAAYVCERFVDTNEVTLDDYVAAIGESDWGYYAAGQATIEELIQWSIIDSDNGSFGALRENFSGNFTSGVLGSDESGDQNKERFRSWLGGMGADTSIADDEEWFPFYTVRDAARFWALINNYLDSGTETAQFLGETLGETETSFIRDGINDSNATIIDKAGWYDDDPTGVSEYNSICDNAVVMVDGHKYLLCMMSSLCYSDANVELFENLAHAVFDTHSNLG